MTLNGTTPVGVLAVVNHPKVKYPSRVEYVICGFGVTPGRSLITTLCTLAVVKGVPVSGLPVELSMPHMRKTTVCPWMKLLARKQPPVTPGLPVPITVSTLTVSHLLPETKGG